MVTRAGCSGGKSTGRPSENPRQDRSGQRSADAGPAASGGTPRSCNIHDIVCRMQSAKRPGRRGWVPRGKPGGQTLRHIATKLDRVPRGQRAVNGRRGRCGRQGTAGAASARRRSRTRKHSQQLASVEQRRHDYRLANALQCACIERRAPGRRGGLDGLHASTVDSECRAVDGRGLQLQFARQSGAYPSKSGRLALKRRLIRGCVAG